MLLRGMPYMEFKILKKSKISRARFGILKTSHGEIETPALVPVATRATVRTLGSEDVEDTKTQVLIANTLHLHLKPGEKIIKDSGGLHKFAGWPRPFMTDSGGFQVFSFGFGKDLGMGKILKKKTSHSIKVGQQPRLVKIGSDGVLFTSYLDGKKIFLGPKESIRIQEALGADIIFAFDECTAPAADHEYTEKSLVRTHQWAEVCIGVKKSSQALFGVVQGGKFKDLRVQSARFLGNLDFHGFGIGGEFGDDKDKMTHMIRWVMEELPQEKPRHLLGIGYPDDILRIVRAGVDTFDCVVPTRFARRGIAFVSKGRLDMGKSRFLKDRKPLDASCLCAVCKRYSRSYISHLVRSEEITALKLLTFHNLYFFNSYIEGIRKKIKEGKL